MEDGAENKRNVWKLAIVLWGLEDEDKEAMKRELVRWMDV